MTKTLLAALLAVGGAAAHAEPANYAIDPSHTAVTFEALHSGTSTLRGRFDKKEGSVTLDKAAKTGKAEITIDMSSVDTGVASLDSNLKSKNFFNAAENATAMFSGDNFTFDGDKVASVGGTLTMLGKTLPVTLKAVNFNCYLHPMLKRETCGGDFDTTITRSAYGMDFGLKFGLPDQIRLLIQIEAIKQQ